MQRKTTNCSSSKSVDGTINSPSNENRSQSWAKMVTKLGLVAAAAVSVSMSGCRSCLDLCHWHQRPVRTHSVHYHVPATANPQVCDPVALPMPSSAAPGMVGGNGISEPVPLYNAEASSGSWPGEPAVDVAPVPRVWGGEHRAPVAQPMQDADSGPGMADVPGAIEIPRSELPPILPASDSRAIEL